MSILDIAARHVQQLGLQKAATSGTLSEHMQTQMDQIFAQAETRQASAQTFDTALDSAQEAEFQTWKQKFAPNDSGQDYDLRGAFKAGLTPDPITGHWADTFKKPNHPTFSDQSQYAPYGKPGHWEGDKFIPYQEPKADRSIYDYMDKALYPLYKGLDLWDKGFNSAADALMQLDPTSNDVYREKLRKRNEGSNLIPETKPFQVAQIGFGGKSNSNQEQQLRELNQGLASSISVPNPVTPHNTTPIQSYDQAEAQRQLQRQQQAEIDRKLGIGVPKPVETEEQHLRRLGLK